MLKPGDEINLTNVYWSSDWNGYEVGYPEIDVVGLYTDQLEPYAYYVNAETGIVLDSWKDDEE